MLATNSTPTHMLHVWNIYHHLPHKWPSYVGKYTIHGAYGLSHPISFEYLVENVSRTKG